MFKFLKRLFEPSLKNKIKTLKMILDSVISFTWYDLLPIICIPILIGYINNYDYENIKRFSIIVLMLTGFLLLIQFFTTKWSVQNKYALEFYLTNKYFKKSILKDPTYMDKIGTGKIQSIVKIGIRSWSVVNNGIIYGLTRVVTGIVTGIYIVLKFDSKYVPYFLLIIIISCLGYYFSGKKN